jgi:lipoprotein-releasing system permease protein
LNSTYFISKRLIFSKGSKNTISSPIIKIAVAAIAIGIVMMIVSVATGTGLQIKIREKIAAFSGHIIITNFDDNQSKVTISPISLRQKFYPKFKAVSGISHIQAVATKAGIIRTASSFEGIIFKGVGKDFDWKNLSEYLIKGRLPIVNQNLNAEILVSQFLANRLNLKVGDNCNTFFMKDANNQLPNLRVFKVVGIYSTGFQDFDATYIIGDIRHVQKLNHWKADQIGAFEVFIDDFSDIKTKGEEVYKETNSTLNTTTIIEKFNFIFDWLRLFDFNILVIIIIMIIVGTINMAVALLVLILERTQTIGILKSIGANNWMIRKIFLYNAAYLIFNGVLIGNIIGILLLFIQQQTGFIALNPESYYVTSAPVNINFINIIAINILTIVVCILILIVPSYLITKITPSKAIKFS